MITVVLVVLRLTRVSATSSNDTTIYQKIKPNSGSWSRLQQRWRQRELERQKRFPSQQPRFQRQNSGSGTRICWKFPTCQQLQRWYGSGNSGFLLDDVEETLLIRWRRSRHMPEEEDTTTTALVQCWLQPNHQQQRHQQQEPNAALFNHNCVGMTNPALSIDITPPLPIGFRARGIENHNHRLYPDRNQKLVQGITTEQEYSVPQTVAATTATTPSSSNHFSQIVWTSARKAVETASPHHRYWWPGTAWIPHAKQEWRVLTFRETVGRGDACYQAVRDAALEWEFHHAPTRRGRRNIDRKKTSGIMAVWPAASSAWLSSGPGRRFVTYTHVVGPVYMINPVTVVYELIDQMGGGGRGLDCHPGGAATTYTSTAYATNRNHWIAGEERVTVIHRKDNHHQHCPSADDGIVDVEIVSFSKPNPHSILGRFVWPFIGTRQRTFFEQQMEAFRRIANAAAATTAENN